MVAPTPSSVGPSTRGSRRLLEAKGVSLPEAPARMLSERVLTEQALVLVMSEEHRQLVLEEAPAVHRRTVGMVDLAAALTEVGTRFAWPELLADVGAKEVHGRWRALPELLGAVSAMPRGVTEVEDPYGRRSDAFERMARQIDAAARTIVRWEAQFPR